MPEEAVENAFKLEEAGADVIDIGAESTRPGAAEISDYEEILRLIPVLKKLRENKFSLPISIDTRKFNVAKKACEYGIEYLNDVSGFADERMIELVKTHSLKAVFMHSLTLPVDKGVVIGENEDVVLFLKRWAIKKIKQFEQRGVSRNNLIFDPGIGFGKTAIHSLEIIRRINEFEELGVKILAGHSEKSFLKLFTNEPAGKRNVETNAITFFLAANKVDYVRVHNVQEARRSIIMVGSL